MPRGLRGFFSSCVGTPLTLRGYEGRHGDLLVAHFDDLDLFVAAGRAELHPVALARLDERTRDGRDPAHVVLGGVHLVDADDAHGLLVARGRGVGDGGAEEHLVGLLARGGIDDLGGLEALGEVADAAVDLAQALLAVLVVRVLGAVAELGRPRHDRGHVRPLGLHEPGELVAHAAPAVRRQVVLGARGNRVLLVVAFEVVLGRVVLAGERLAHFSPSTKARMPPSSISTAMAVRMRPIRRSNACIARSPSQRCRRSPASSSTVVTAITTTSAPASMPRRCGECEASSITVASADGPAMSGMASGTMSGSPASSLPNVPSKRPNTMRIAIMKRITPPAMDKDVCVSCMTDMICGPKAPNAARIAKAIAHSRRMIARRRGTGMPASMAFTTGTLPNGSTTSRRMMTAERNSPGME